MIEIDYLAAPLGAVIVRTREDPIIEGIVGARCGSPEQSQEGRGWVSPMVLIDEQTKALGPGAGDVANARLWMQEGLFVFRCIANNGRQAEQIAHRVIALWHEFHRREGAIIGSGGVRFRAAWLGVYNGAVDEPKLRRSVATVRMRILSAGATVAG